MSGTNLTAKLQANSDVTVILQNETNLAAYIYTDSALPTDSDQYAYGCICIKRSLPYGVYTNTSNGSTPSWFAVQISPTDPFLLTGTTGIIRATGTQTASTIPDGAVGQVLTIAVAGYSWTNAGAGDVIQAGNNAFTGSNTHTGTEDFTSATIVGIDKTTVGLSNVDNTADINKPISTATAASLSTKFTNSVTTARLLGRFSAGTGVAEEIQIGTNLSLTAGTLNATAMTSLNAQSGTSQTFANDTNVVITSAVNVHTLAWSGILAEIRGGTGQGSYNVGDIMYANSVSTLLRLPIGSNGQHLIIAGGVPAWAASASSGIQSINGDTTAAQIVNTGSAGTDVNVSNAVGITTINVPASSASVSGKLLSTDWSTFNNKISSTRTISTTTPLQGGGDLSANRTLSINQSNTSQDGYLSTSDWNIFNNKQTTTLTNGKVLVGSVGNLATEQTLTGDVTMSNTGVTTLASVGSAGTFGTTVLLPVITTDAKGRITAVSTSPINHDGILNYVANQHINHTSVSLLNGNGITATGLGDISASRTINVDVANTADRQAQTANKMLDASSMIDENSLTSNSNSRIPTQSSVKAYADTLFNAGLRYRGVLLGSSNLTTNTTVNTYWNTASPITSGSTFDITTTGTLTVNSGTISVVSGDVLRVLNDTTRATVTVSDIVILGATYNTGSIVIQTPVPLSVSGGTTRYVSCGGASLFAAEANTKVPQVVIGTYAMVKANILTNTLSGTCVVTLRKNGVSSPVTFTVPAATTGIFTSTGIQAVAIDDLINLEIVGTGTGSVELSVIITKIV